METAKKNCHNRSLSELPSKFDVNELEITQEFSESRPSAKLQDELLNAIRGSGAFRYFRDTIRRRGIEQAWYDFKAESLKEIAREWCEEHGIEYE